MCVYNIHLVYKQIVKTLLSLIVLNTMNIKHHSHLEYYCHITGWPTNGYTLIVFSLCMNVLTVSGSYSTYCLSHKRFSARISINWQHLMCFAQQNEESKGMNLVNEINRKYFSEKSETWFKDVLSSCRKNITVWSCDHQGKSSQRYALNCTELNLCR